MTGRFPWAAGTATAVGSHPGTDPAEALRIVLGELPGLPQLPELPARGPGADMIGRTASLLVDLAVELQPSGWRFADRPGRDARRADDHLARDLDVLEQLAGSGTGPFKIQVCGPWTLAAGIELRHGDRALKDPGAVRDVIASLTEGVAGHVAEVARRLPGAEILVQVDEPMLPAVLAGSVPTASGFGRLRAVEEPVVQAGLRRVLDGSGGWPLVHCCAPRVPFALLRGAGAKGVSIDMSLTPRRDDEALGELIDAGVALFAGVLPATGTEVPAVQTAAAPVRELWRRLGFPAGGLGEQVVVTPACGLAGAAPGYVRAALARCREVARTLYEAADR